MTYYFTLQAITLSEGSQLIVGSPVAHVDFGTSLRDKVTDFARSSQIR